MLNDILWPDHIQWQPPTDQTLYWTRPFTEFWVVSIEHLRRVWHADRGRLLLWTPGPVPLGLAYVLLVETNPFPNLSLFYRTMIFEYPSVLSRFYSKIEWREEGLRSKPTELNSNRVFVTIQLKRTIQLCQLCLWSTLCQHQTRVHFQWPWCC